MYSATMMVHSLLRWLVLLTGLLAIARAYSRRGAPWSPADNRAGLLFTIALDLQLLVGLLLYFGLSPYTQVALDNMAGAMRDTTLRYWGVEHPFGMLIGLVLAHVGRVRIRKATSDAQRHGLASMFFTLALIAIVISIPWPGMPNGRPLLRW